MSTIIDTANGMSMRSAGHPTSNKSADQYFSLRIEDDRLILAKAVRQAGGDWLVSTDSETLNADHIFHSTVGWVEALGRLRARQEIDRTPVAVSLSGDFCVTRISTGTTEDVDQELELLAGRIPRYLQLGPGGKLTGQVRDSLTPGIDHALTAVANHRRLEWIAEVLEQCDFKIAWIEPSLVSLARLSGWLALDQQKPILIADSFGKSWEVGIVHQGRLLLDYRPAAAYDSKRFATAIDQHLSRLRRFCQRHRGIDQSDLSQIFLGGDPAKTQIVIDHFASINDLEALPLEVPLHHKALTPEVSTAGNEKTLTPLKPAIRVTSEGEDSQPERSDQVAAVAAILPCLIDSVGEEATHQTPPDLLQSIRIADQHSDLLRFASTWWPAVATILLLSVGYGYIYSQQQRLLVQQEQRERVELQMRQTRVRLASLQSERFLVEQLESIRRQTASPPASQLITLMTQCLPPQSHLTAIRFDTDAQIHLDGHTIDETEIYETVGYMRRLPHIDQVALLGTTPDDQNQGAAFQIRLHWSALAPSDRRAQEDQGP